jgi:protoheme IX farnesyltransferase
MTDRAMPGGSLPAGSLDLAAGGASASDYIQLLKPRVMTLVVFTGFVGMMLAPEPIHPLLALMALISIATGAGAAGALNMWFDADIDRLMSRTSQRPIPQGKVAPGDALGFGLVLAVAAVSVMALTVDFLAALLLAATIAFYVGVYTMWLKRATVQNIVIGGAAGALPPVIGWAAASHEIGLYPLVLFAIIFLWTPPHFWALALSRRGDYARAGVPMLPVVEGARATCRQILLYCLLLVPVSLLPFAFGYAGNLFAAVALGLGLILLLGAVRLFSAGKALDVAGVRFFAFSILYLLLLFAALLAEKGLGLA